MGWTIHHKGSVSGRPFESKTYSEGGYRVSTVSADDYDGDGYRDGNSVVIMPPVAAGAPIDIDAETKSELETELLSAGFSPTEAAQIIGTLP